MSNTLFSINGKLAGIGSKLIASDNGDIPNVNTYPFVFDFDTGTITGYAADATGDVVIPSSFGETPVEHIGEGAFANYVHVITSVTFPSTLKTIESRAFNTMDGNVTIGMYGALNFPSSLEYIGDFAFASWGGINGVDITSLVTLPASVTYVGNGAFAGIHESRLVLNSHITSYMNINDNFLAGYICRMSDMPETTIPANVTDIASDAFNGRRMQEIAFVPADSKQAISIGDRAFKDCELQLTNGELPFLTPYIGESSFENNYITTLSLGNDSLSIEFSSFSFKNAGIEYLYLNHVNNVGYQQYPFHNNPLAEVTITNSDATDGGAWMYLTGDSALNALINSTTMSNGSPTGRYYFTGGAWTFEGDDPFEATLSHTNLEFEYNGEQVGGPFDVTLMLSGGPAGFAVTWTAYSYDPWCTVSPDSGDYFNSENFLTITCDGIPDDQERYTTVYIDIVDSNSNHLSSLQIEITQFGAAI